MIDISVLITCFNRKDKTVSCLTHLYSALNYYNHCKSENEQIAICVYLTDDGCKDGTADAVRETFSNKKIIILQGDGNLYWAGGMRFAWKEALKENFDYYLLLNDDTEVFDNVFNELFKTHVYCLNNYKNTGIYSGCTSASNDFNKTTYGGDVWINKFFATKRMLNPTGTPQMCDMANGNILLIHKSVVEKIGIFFEKYIHGPADHDYTIIARRKKIPVLVTAHFCGKCDNDHYFNLQEFVKWDFIKRKQYLNSPHGLAKDQLIYIRRISLYRYPIAYFGYFTKLYFPKFYLFIANKRPSQ